MDGCGQMVFCTHLSYTADRKGGRREHEREKNKKEVFIDCKVSTLLPRTALHSLNLALLVLHHLLYVPVSFLSPNVSGAAIVAFCQAGCILASTDNTPQITKLGVH